MRIPLALGALSTLALALASCTGAGNRLDVQLIDATLDAHDMGVPTYEAGTDTALLGRVCQRDQECDDGVSCTDDRCSELGRCVNVPVHELCDDHLYCTGAERCDMRRGCIGGEPVNCNDNNVCTADRCDEATRTCQHRPLDRDGDGDPDDHCEARECGDGGVESDSGAPGTCWRGHDCDDSNPRVSSTLPEICGDMLDNDCDGRTDAMDPGGCSTPAHDRCSDPLDVSAGGAFTLEMGGLARDYSTPCTGGYSRDAVVRFHLDSPRDIEIVGSSRTSFVTLALQTACGSSAPMDTLECAFDFPATLRRHSLPAGDYFLIVGSSGNGEVDLDVRFSAPTPPPTNDTCASATVLTASGTYPGSTVGLRNDYALPCNGGSYADAVWEFTLASPQNVTISTNVREYNAAVALVPNCASPLAPLRCARGWGGTPSFRVYNLPAGTYRIIAETGTTTADFLLTLRMDPPSSAPPEDACPSPEPGASIDLADGMPHVARTGELEDEYTLSCDSFRGARDAVYRLTLDATSDVRISARAPSGSTYVSFRNSPCASPSSERRCVPTGGAGSMDVDFSQRGLPAGTYWVIVENRDGADVTVQATVGPPSPVVTYSAADAPAGVSFIDVCSMTGSRRTLMTTDDRTVQIPEAGSGVTIPFPLRMYGLDVSAPIAVSSNGWMSLSSTTSTSLGGRIPDPADPNMTLAPFWTDLYTRASGVCYGVVGTAPNRQLVVQWQDLHYCCSDDAAVHLTFEAIINEAPAGSNNVIDFVYQRLDGPMTRMPTAGIENDDGSEGTLVPGMLGAPRAVRFTPSR